MIFLTLGDKIFILERASGEFQDDNSVPSCKKDHSLAHASKNLYILVDPLHAATSGSCESRVYLSKIVVGSRANQIIA